MIDEAIDWLANCCARLLCVNVEKMREIIRREIVMQMSTFIAFALLIVNDVLGVSIFEYCYLAGAFVKLLRDQSSSGLLANLALRRTFEHNLTLLERE